MNTLNEFPLWTAIVTPLNEDGSLDLESYANILQEQNEAKNGILVLGSTGESLNLTLSERKELLEFTLTQDLQVPLMVGVPGSNLEATKEWVSYLNGHKIDALLMVTPLYAKPETEGQYQWFKILMDLSEKPVMLYNVPSRTGKELSHSCVKRLKDHPNFWALKEASGSTAEFEKYVADTGESRVLSGDDGLLPAFSNLGCSGLVSVASNAWPKETHLYVEMALGKKLSPEDISLWDACSAALFCVSNPIPVKRLMHEEGRIKTSHLKLPLSHKDLSQAATVAEASTRIQSWYKKNKKEE
jgi:4-hydroxy-tetrahydrodipicolinate synthase